MVFAVLAFAVAAVFLVLGAGPVVSAEHRDRFIASRWPDRLACGNMRTPGRARVLGLWWMGFAVLVVLLTLDVL